MHDHLNHPEKVGTFLFRHSCTAPCAAAGFVGTRSSWHGGCLELRWAAVAPVSNGAAADCTSVRRRRRYRRARHIGCDTVCGRSVRCSALGRNFHRRPRHRPLAYHGTRAAPSRRWSASAAGSCAGRMPVPLLEHRAIGSTTVLEPMADNDLTLLEKQAPPGAGPPRSRVNRWRICAHFPHPAT